MFRSTASVGSFVSRRLLAPRWYSTHLPQPEKKITLLDLAKKHKEGIPLSMVTAYDYTSAYFVDKAAVDVILVGDSLGMVMLGRDSTTEVTMDEMLHHCKAVARGSKRSFVVGDLPFGSFEVSVTEAVRNACRLVKEGSVAAVKLEGGKVRKSTVKAIVEAGIPVVGHIGLTPQTAGPSGGFRVHGKSAQAAAAIFEDALALQDAGCSALVIEFVPELLGQAITKGLHIPTFGIGAGRFTSGQVLVYHDMLGMYPNFTPKFCKQYPQCFLFLLFILLRLSLPLPSTLSPLPHPPPIENTMTMSRYTNLAEEITKGISTFKQEVETHQFPSPGHTFSMKVEEWHKAHDLISQAHPDKEGADSAIASALAHVKASLDTESSKAKEVTSKGTAGEQATAVAKATSPEKATGLEKLTSLEKATGLEKATNQTQKTDQTPPTTTTTKQQPTPSSSQPRAPPSQQPLRSSQSPTTPLPSSQQSLPSSQPRAAPPPTPSLPLLPPQTHTWDTDFTNFDIYYKSLFSNNEEREEERISFEVHRSSGRRRMQA